MCPPMAPSPSPSQPSTAGARPAHSGELNEHLHPPVGSPLAPRRASSAQPVPEVPEGWSASGSLPPTRGGDVDARSGTDKYPPDPPLAWSYRPPPESVSPHPWE